MSDALANALWALAGGGIGWAATVLVMRRNGHKRHVEVMRMRRILDLPDRDAPQQGARGTARIHTAEYREKDPEHGMEM